MSKFIELSEDVWVNLDHVAIVSDEDKGTTLEFPTGTKVHIDVDYNLFIKTYLKEKTSKKTKEKTATLAEPTARKKKAAKKKAAKKK